MSLIRAFMIISYCQREYGTMNEPIPSTYEYAVKNFCFLYYRYIFKYNLNSTDLRVSHR
jgi:hypothetical protein